MAETSQTKDKAPIPVSNAYEIQVTTFDDIKSDKEQLAHGTAIL